MIQRMCKFVAFMEGYLSIRERYYCNPTHPSKPAQKEKTQSKSCHLFLSSGSLIGLLLRPLLTLASVSCLTSGISQFSVSTTLNWLRQLALLDFLNGSVGVNDRETVPEARDRILNTRDLLLGSITLLVLTKFAGEENETGAVFL